MIVFEDRGGYRGTVTTIKSRCKCIRGRFRTTRCLRKSCCVVVLGYPGIRMFLKSKKSLVLITDGFSKNLVNIPKARIQILSTFAIIMCFFWSTTHGHNRGLHTIEIFRIKYMWHRAVLNNLCFDTSYRFPIKIF
jgi:hypothetical protein